MYPLFNSQQYMTELAIRENDETGTEYLLLVAEIHPTNEAMHLYAVAVKRDFDNRFAYCDPAVVRPENGQKQFLATVSRPNSGGNLMCDDAKLDDLLHIIFGQMATPLGMALLLRRVVVTLWGQDEKFKERYDQALEEFGGRISEGADSTTLNIQSKGAGVYERELKAQQ